MKSKEKLLLNLYSVICNVISFVITDLYLQQMNIKAIEVWKWQRTHLENTYTPNWGLQYTFSLLFKNRGGQLYFPSEYISKGRQLYFPSEYISKGWWVV
jgi:hypothetical protein